MKVLTWELSSITAAKLLVKWNTFPAKMKAGMKRVSLKSLSTKMGMRLCFLHSREGDVVVSRVEKVIKLVANRAVVAVTRALRDQVEEHDRKDSEDAELEREGTENAVLGSEVLESGVLEREAAVTEVDAMVVEDHRQIAAPVKVVSVAVVVQEVVDHRAVNEVKEARAVFRDEVTAKIEDAVNAENAIAVAKEDSGIVVPARAASDQIDAEKVVFPIEGQVAIAIRVNEAHALEVSASEASVNAVQENEVAMGHHAADDQEVHVVVNAVRSAMLLEAIGPEVTGPEVMVPEAIVLTVIEGIEAVGRVDRVEDALVVEADDLALVDFAEAAPAVDLVVAADLAAVVDLAVAADLAAVVVGRAEAVVEEETKFEISLVAAA